MTNETQLFSKLQKYSLKNPSGAELVDSSAGVLVLNSIIKCYSIKRIAIEFMPCS